MENVWIPLTKLLATACVIYLVWKLRHPERLKWSISLRNFMLIVVILFVLWFMFFVIIPMIKGNFP